MRLNGGCHWQILPELREPFRDCTRNAFAFRPMYGLRTNWIARRHCSSIFPEFTAEGVEVSTFSLVSKRGLNAGLAATVGGVTAAAE